MVDYGLIMSFVREPLPAAPIGVNYLPISKLLEGIPPYLSGLFGDVLSLLARD